MASKGRSFLVTQAQRAAALGHALDLEHREPPADQPKGRHKWWAVCSCGYRSTARATQAQALHAAFWHAGGVAGEASSTRNGDTPSRVNLPPTGTGSL